MGFCNVAILKWFKTNNMGFCCLSIGSVHGQIEKDQAYRFRAAHTVTDACTQGIW